MSLLLQRSINVSLLAERNRHADADCFIHTWLQPGARRARISRKPFKRFPNITPMFLTWLKPRVNKKNFELKVVTNRRPDPRTHKLQLDSIRRFPGLIS